MNHHVTIELESSDDFQLLIQVIKTGGFELFRVDACRLTLQCSLDDLLLSITKNYLGGRILFNQEIRPKKIEVTFPNHNEKLRSDTFTTR